MRTALYFTPPSEARVTQLAAEWLGRDAFSGERSRAPDPALDSLVAEPSRYGFHATMKPPFRLSEGRDLQGLDEALARFTGSRPSAVIPSLVLRRIDGFFALVPENTVSDLDALAAETVRHFEPFRAPLSEAEIARRNPERLSERQRGHLHRWGYPFVFEEFRFHMTLTGRVHDDTAPEIENALRERFGEVLGRPLPIDALALFVQNDAGAPFTVHTRHSFGGLPRTASA